MPKGSDDLSGIASDIFYLFDPDSLGADAPRPLGHNVPVETPGATDFYDNYVTRIRDLREAIGLSQEKMAKALGLPADRYRKYETIERRGLPPHLMERFCIVTDTTLDYLITGQRRTRRRTVALARLATQPD
jgi:hypothetical protein